jgi:Ala-tRNA(Pro) deacylase
VESAEVRGTDLQEGAKALILKSDTSHVMIVVPADKQVEISKIESRLDSKVSLESPDIIKSQYGLDIGAVPPIGTMFGMKVYVDNKLFENERIAFNSGLRTSSIIMNPKDLSTVMDFEKGDFVE